MQEKSGKIETKWINKFFESDIILRAQPTLKRKKKEIFQQRSFGDYYRGTDNMVAAFCENSHLFDLEIF